MPRDCVCKGKNRNQGLFTEALILFPLSIAASTNPCRKSNQWMLTKITINLLNQWIHIFASKEALDSKVRSRTEAAWIETCRRQTRYLCTKHNTVPYSYIQAILGNGNCNASYYSRDPHIMGARNVQSVIFWEHPKGE